MFAPHVRLDSRKMRVMRSYDVEATGPEPAHYDGTDLIF